MRKTIAVFVVVITTGFGCSLRPASAQESKDGVVAGERVQPYRLDFSLNEMEDGKKINTRHYSMNLNEGDKEEMKIGTRVPVPTSSPSANDTQFQYVDVGTRIDSHLTRVGEDLQLYVSSEVSNIDTTSPGQHPTLGPIIRQIKIEGSTLLVTGKPLPIGSVDDPNSKRQFQLEVTATKLR
jgi:hypothetical protein